MADLAKLAQEATALIPEGTLQIQVHRLGLGTSEFASGAELAQALTIPDLARVDLVAVRVDRPKAHDLSLVAVSFTAKMPAATIEAKGTNQELVTGALSTLSRAIESGVQFPRSNYGLWQFIGIVGFAVAVAVFDAVAFAVGSGKTLSAEASAQSYPLHVVATVILIDLLLFLGARWLLAPFELLPADSAPRLKRLWAFWVLPLVIALLATGAWSVWPALTAH